MAELCTASLLHMRVSLVPVRGNAVFLARSLERAKSFVPSRPDVIVCIVAMFEASLLYKAAHICSPFWQFCIRL
jgi:hypothetical protein